MLRMKQHLNYRINPAIMLPVLIFEPAWYEKIFAFLHIQKVKFIAKKYFFSRFNDYFQKIILSVIPVSNRFRTSSNLVNKSQVLWHRELPCL